MAQYKYSGTNQEGKTVRGTMAAANEKDLYQKLRDTNIYMTESREISKAAGRHRIKTKAVSEFCRSLGTLLQSGVSLVRALSIVSQEETTKPEYRDIYMDLLKLVRQGGLLSDAMREQGEAFPDMLIYMIQSAEASGSLDKVCMQMAEHFEKDYRMRTKVRNAMIYPMILLVMTIVVILIIFTFVIPQFAELFAGMSDLPATTKLVMGISDGLKAHWLLILILVIAAGLAVSIIFRIPVIRRGWDKVKVHAPVVGKLLRVIYTARFARTLSSLYAAGLPMVNALQISRNTIGNTYIESQFDELIAHIRSGGSLFEGISNVDGFTQKLASSIMIGEETGSLDSMLKSIADILDYESEMAIGRMITLLEPIMIIIMGVIVGFLIISVITPIYSSYNSIESSSYN